MSDLKDIPDVASLMDALSELAQLFDKVSVNQTPNSVTSSADGKTSNVVSSNISNITPEIFVKIKDQIQILRHNLTKK